MWLSEQFLYILAGLLYKSEVAHSSEMKKALSDKNLYDNYRKDQIDRITSICKLYDVMIADKKLLDLGCNDGAISRGYVDHDARSVVGVDIDASAIARANERNTDPRVTFHTCTITSIPIEDNQIDTIICYDVLEHVSQPEKMLLECRRVLKDGGQLLIGTWGWHHPFAPHLWSTMPVPWAHVIFSERTLLRACRKVYQSRWYRPTMHDVGPDGRKIEDKYTNEIISTEYLNKFLIKDFELVFKKIGMDYTIFYRPFGKFHPKLFEHLVKFEALREYLTGYIWVVLTKKNEPRSME